MELSQGERLSTTWRKVYEHLEGRLRTAQLQLEASTPFEKTLELRGQIREIRALMDLNKEPVDAQFDKFVA